MNESASLRSNVCLEEMFGDWPEGGGVAPADRGLACADPPRSRRVCHRRDGRKVSRRCLRPLSPTTDTWLTSALCGVEVAPRLVAVIPIGALGSWCALIKGGCCRLLDLPLTSIESRV
jgi:hypothetical protein